jgi:23S rRNA (adenine2030-N6)-methyltransferase
MLSYRHGFHAGNHGDVLKHAVLTLIVEYMQRKEKPFLFIDTHAGAGRYDLQSEWARKNREFESGISVLWQRDDLPPELLSYINTVRQMNPDSELHWYPGSPWLFRQLMRKQDKARLFELHPSEGVNLQNLFADERKVKVDNRDGLQALKALLPPLEHRAFVLIDPSYETKSDFKTVVNTLKEAYRRFASGVYMLWYPVIQPVYTRQLEDGFRNSGIKNILQAELITADAPGMKGSGIIVINPPWILQDQLQNILPYLVEHLGFNNKGHYRIETLAAE